jgi:hypothetical protein
MSIDLERLLPRTETARALTEAGFPITPATLATKATRGGDLLTGSLAADRSIDGATRFNGHTVAFRGRQPTRPKQRQLDALERRFSQAGDKLNCDLYQQTRRQRLLRAANCAGNENPWRVSKGRLAPALWLDPVLQPAPHRH